MSGRSRVVVASSVLVLAGVTAFSITQSVQRSRIKHPRSGVSIVVPGTDGAVRMLHNGWRISPAGRHIVVSDMPLGGAVGPDGTLLAIATCGFNANAVHIVDVASEKTVASLPLAKAMNGIAWAPDGRRLYIAGGVANPLNDIYVMVSDPGSGWARAKGFTLAAPARSTACISGLALSPDGDVLWAANLTDDCLYGLDTRNGAVLSKLPVGSRPIVVRRVSGTMLAVANWAGAEVAIVDVSVPASPSVVRRCPVSSHPNDVCVSRDGRLFVSCGNSDCVDVVDVQTGAAVERIRTSFAPKAPSGSTPNAVSLDSAERTLYIANADSNAVCVVDVSDRAMSVVRGFIPCGWYPTAVLAGMRGKLLVASGKGTGTEPNPAKTPINAIVPAGFAYIGRHLNGLLSFVDTPNPQALAGYTAEVARNSPYRDDLLRAVPSRHRSVVPKRVGDPCPIRYVLYIIKENRTYDQVFGDIAKGNGDPDLCLFGRDITPNQHALAEEYVLLDNLYCSGEVSQDGHPWSTSAYCTDFTQRAWPVRYSGRGDVPGAQALTDSGAGFIWETCRRARLTYRSYGEYSGHSSLSGHENLEFVGKAGPGSAPPGRDTDRAGVFIREFKEFEAKGTLPRFMVMSLGENHTNGTRAGSFTPKAMVASNDLAVGRIVETISRSSVWNEFAIFVIEDDAQNGPDHIDSHRTTGLVISPYVRRGVVDSTMYSTTSMLRTMELILGLPPLTQYDAGATPMSAAFGDRSDPRRYTAAIPRTDLNARNPSSAYGAAQSAKMDWSGFDRIDEQALNRILWHSIKGTSAPYPVPVRSGWTAQRMWAR